MMNHMLITAYFGRNTDQFQKEDVRGVKMHGQFRKWEISPGSRKARGFTNTFLNVNEHESSWPGQLSVNSLVPSNLAQQAQHGEGGSDSGLSSPPRQDQAVTFRKRTGKNSSSTLGRTRNF